MDEFYRDLGVRLRAARTAPGLSQAELAKRLKLSRASVANIELGKQRISVRKFVAWAEALGTTPAALLPAPPGIARGLARAMSDAGYRTALVDWAHQAAPTSIDQDLGSDTAKLR